MHKIKKGNNKMKKLRLEFNSQEKAEKVIFADKGKHKLQWKKYSIQFSDKVTYLIFYTPIQAV